MQLGVLITNHGKHSNEKLAVAVAADIINIGANASGQQAIDGRKLDNQIVEIMERYFAKLADYEHAEIESKGTAHLASESVVNQEILNDAQHEIILAIGGSPFASWFTSAQIEDYVNTAVEKWLRSAHHMHRDWFARWGKVGDGTDLKASDKHDPESDHVKNWIAAA